MRPIIITHKLLSPLWGFQLQFSSFPGVPARSGPSPLAIVRRPIRGLVLLQLQRSAYVELSPFSHPVDGDVRRSAQAAGKCGRMVLDMANVDDLVFQRRHLIPGKAALRSREIEGFDAVIDHPI